LIVLDASVAIEWLLQTPAASKIERRILAGRADLHAPHLLDLEVTQVLRRYVAARHVAATRAEEALQDLLDLPLTRYRHDPFVFRIWDLRHRLTVYDAIYVVLAEALGAVLITCDRKLAASAGHSAKIELVDG
jgi:predicted nucleic acid-binding protein